MGEPFPTTRLTLIGALGRGLRWEEFLALYGRLILLWGRRDFGLRDAEAEDLRQEVLVRVWRGIGGYDPARGRFRNWLYACTRNAVVSLWRAGRRQPPPAGGRLEEVALPPEPPPWERGREAADLDDALRLLDEEGFARDDLQRAVADVRGRVQSDTWKAFLLFEFFGMRAREIGPRLGLRPAAVNQAVFRVRRLLRQALEESRP